MAVGVTWQNILTLATIVALVALWAWGTGFWMGTYFVSRADYTVLEQRVIMLEKR